MTHKTFTLILSLLLATTLQAQSLRFLVGTYTENSSSEGVYLYEFNPRTGKATLLDQAPSGNPSFVILSEDQETAYAVNEFGDGRQAVSSFTISGNSITPLNSVPIPDYLAQGQDPCNILISQGMLITSNYSGGSASTFPILYDGEIDQSSLAISFGEGSHIHCATESPDGRYIFLNDLGRDCIFQLRLRPHDKPAAELTYAWQNTDSFPYGPRHMVFSQDGRFAYLLCELGDMLVVFSYVDGSLIPIQTLKAYKGDGHGSADIHLSPDGKFLYTSHRLKDDGISIFKVDPKTGMVKQKGYRQTGRHPRNFAISPDGKYLLCACRDDNRIEVYKRNPRTGALRRIKKDILLGAPVCVQFFK